MLFPSIMDYADTQKSPGSFLSVGSNVGGLLQFNLNSAYDWLCHNDP